MTYAKWERTVPEAISRDVLWRIEAYRLALYASHLAWSDTSVLAPTHRGSDLSRQLVRAVDSISANLVEGYSRHFRREKAHFLDYALGSAREARDWYYKGRFVLGDGTIRERLELFTSIVKLLAVMVARERVRNRAQPPRP